MTPRWMTPQGMLQQYFTLDPIDRGLAREMAFAYFTQFELEHPHYRRMEPPALPRWVPADAMHISID